MGTYVRKTRDLFTVQSYTGSRYGWEDETTETTRAEARKRLMEYRENAPSMDYRIRKTRERITRPVASPRTTLGA